MKFWRLIGAVVAALSWACSLAQPIDVADTCYGKPFGFGALGTDQSALSLPNTSEVLNSNDVKGPFVGKVPPEIRLIKRGGYKEFIGGWINDGLSHWTGVDLDRREIIWVSRQVWDERSKRPRNVHIPDPKNLPSALVVRSWMNPEETRVEMEVVRRDRLNAQELMAFICLANAEWALLPPSNRVPPLIPTDTLSLYYLLSNVSSNNQGVAVRETKHVQRDGVTWFAVDALIAKRLSIWKY